MEQNPTNLFNVFLNSNDSIDIVNVSFILGNVNAGGAASTSITNVSSIQKLFVGMRVSDDGTYIDAGTTIASIDTANDTITLSQNTKAGVAAVAHIFNFSGSNTSNSCIFNLGSILDQAPNAQELENVSSCLIKVKYFTIERTTAEFTTDQVSTVQIRMNNQYPNNLETQPINPSYNTNTTTSNIIGLLPTGYTDYTYSDLNSNPNDYVAIANPFKGQTTIKLTNQNGTLLSNASTQDKEWNMWLCIYIPVQPKIVNLNMPSINY